MKCEASGIITSASSPIIGTTSKGKDFEKIEYVIKTDDIYHKDLMFTVMSFDGPIEDAPRVGDHITVNFTVESREYKGKWYTNATAYRITNKQ